MSRTSENKTRKKASKAAASKNAETVKAAEVQAEAVAEVKEEVVAEVNAEEAPKTTRAKKEPKAPRKPRTTKAEKEAKAAATKTEEKPKRAYTKRGTKGSSGVNVTLQADGRGDLSINDLVYKVKAAYVAEGHEESSIKKVEVYVKLSENMAYYVIDGYASGISLY